ncbi:MAG: hypothetical protein KTR31_07600 [Myxococcales bacterium]|nr:hypothetical protein [Myxococcales bacterium]
MRSAFVAAGLVACVSCSGQEPPKLLDTGWFEEGTALTGDCMDVLVSTVPADGSTEVYWQERPMVFTGTDRVDRYDAWLLDAESNLVATERAWSETDLGFEMSWGGVLAPSTDYTLVVQDCVQTHEIRFTTSELGTALDPGPESLVGNTYVLDLRGAEWVEPPNLAPLVTIYLTDPILLGVKLATDTQLELIGGPGRTDPLGVVTQDRSAPTWDFPVVSFDGQPFFETGVDEIALQTVVNGDVADIPVRDFLFQGTFAADGSAIGGGTLSGLADTRELSEAINGDQAFLCNTAAGLGVECGPCTDGELFCLDLVVRDIAGTLQPGLLMVDQ